MTYYNVGKIVNTQGALQGELRVLSVTDFADERFAEEECLALSYAYGDSQSRHPPVPIIAVIKKARTLFFLKRSSMKSIYRPNTKFSLQTLCIYNLSNVIVCHCISLLSIFLLNKNHDSTKGLSSSSNHHKVKVFFGSWSRYL